MQSNGQKKGNLFERHGWIVFLVLSLIITLFGLGDIVTGGATFESGEGPTLLGISGMTWQELQTSAPNAALVIDYLVRAGGAHLFVFGLVSIAISITALRRGERWAWWAMWVWAGWLALVVLLLLGAYKRPGPGIPPPFVSGSIFIVLVVATQFLSLRKYFPGSGHPPARVAAERA